MGTQHFLPQDLNFSFLFIDVLTQSRIRAEEGFLKEDTVLKKATRVAEAGFLVLPPVNDVTVLQKIVRERFAFFKRHLGMPIWA